MKKRGLFIVLTVVLIAILSSALIWFVFSPPIQHSESTKLAAPEFYPSPQITPGEVFPDITKKDVCTPNYTAKVRLVSESVARRVHQNYGVAYPHNHNEYELDHFIPLELGGTNSEKNLFMQKSNPRPGFHEKDQVENYLHREVCDGRLTLKEAQEKIRKDWYRVYIEEVQPRQKKRPKIDLYTLRFAGLFYSEF